MRTTARLTFTAAILILLACSLATPAPTPEPTATFTPVPPFPTGTPTGTPTRTPTPVVIVVTATPAPTPTVNPQDIYVVPGQTVFAGLWAEAHGWDFRVSGSIGVAKDSRVYRGFESPADSGKLFMGVFGIVDDKWSLLDTLPMETPTPSPTPTLGAGGEARAW